MAGCGVMPVRVDPSSAISPIPLFGNGSELRHSGTATRAAMLEAGHGDGLRTGGRPARSAERDDGMGGPRRRPRGSAPAPCRVVVRLSERELEFIRAAAAGPGRGVSLSRFVADAALLAAGGAAVRPAPRRAPSTLVLAELMTAVAAVNRVGNNLNQLAREKNTTGLRPVGTSDAEASVAAALRQLTALVQRAAGDAP